MRHNEANKTNRTAYRDGDRDQQRTEQIDHQLAALHVHSERGGCILVIVCEFRLADTGNPGSKASHHAKYQSTSDANSV